MRATSPSPPGQVCDGASAIKFAMRRFPRLSADGIVPVAQTRNLAHLKNAGARHRQAIVYQPIVPAEVECAIEFLAMLTPTKSARVDSYYLKHRAEDWCREHDLCSNISNGALIVAALALGLPVEPCGPLWLSNPNAAIGVRRKDVKRLTVSSAVLRLERRGILSLRNSAHSS